MERRDIKRESPYPSNGPPRDAFLNLGPYRVPLERTDEPTLVYRSETRPGARFMLHDPAAEASFKKSAHGGPSYRARAYLVLANVMVLAVIVRMARNAPDPRQALIILLVAYVALVGVALTRSAGKSTPKPRRVDEPVARP